MVSYESDGVNYLRAVFFYIKVFSTYRRNVFLKPIEFLIYSMLRVLCIQECCPRPILASYNDYFEIPRCCIARILHSVVASAILLFRKIIIISWNKIRFLFKLRLYTFTPRIIFSTKLYNNRKYNRDKNNRHFGPALE